jgi:hypothetical protein
MAMTDKPVLLLVEPSHDSAESAMFLAVAMERERCAKIAENFARKCGSVIGREAAADIAVRIRGNG